MSRPYRSRLREEQAASTRERIVDALLEQVLESDRQSFSVAQVAERARVSERTVYRHFPTREALVEAIDGRLAETPKPAMPASFDELPEHVDELYAWLDEHRDLVAAAHAAGLGRELHLRARARRGEQVRRTLMNDLERLSEREQRRIFAVFRTMFGSAIWRAMRDEVGLSSEEAREAARWVAELVVGDVRRRLGEASESEDRFDQEGADER